MTIVSIVDEFTGSGNLDGRAPDTAGGSNLWVEPSLVHTVSGGNLVLASPGFDVAQIYTGVPFYQTGTSHRVQLDIVSSTTFRGLVSIVDAVGSNLGAVQFERSNITNAYPTLGTGLRAGVNSPYGIVGTPDKFLIDSNPSVAITGVDFIMEMTQISFRVRLGATWTSYFSCSFDNSAISFDEYYHASCGVVFQSKWFFSDPGSVSSSISRFEYTGTFSPPDSSFWTGFVGSGEF